MSKGEYKTEAALVNGIAPRPAGGRNSNYCAYCGQPGGSSSGNHTYSQTRAYWWWHCRKCGKDYDLISTEHKLPPGMRSPFDKEKKGGKKKAPAKDKQSF